MVNFTCPTIPDKPSDPKPFFNDGNIDFKAHDVGWLVCGIMALIATISSIWLIVKHLTYYTCPQQQRHIVRLLVMVPIYAIVSFMSYLFYQEALYYQTIRDCYEAVLATSFFYLILAYTGDTRAEQHAVFRSIDTKEKGFWVWPFGRWKYAPEGLHFLWLMKISVLQYAIIRPLCTFIAVGTEYFGWYCLHSWMPWFTHVWCALFISISVSVAMYCLIQLYMPVRKLVDPYKPILKFLSIKTIVFLTFWQDTLLSFLVSFDAIKETEYFTAEQIQAGINALLQCFWMLLFGFIHIKAFSYLPYRPEDRSRTTRKGRAMLDAMDFRDWFWEMKESTRYIAARSKGRNYTLAEDLRAKRHEHLLKALGKERTAILDAEIDMEKQAMPTFWKNPEDAQFWIPGSNNESGSEMSKHNSSSNSRHGVSGGDAYSPLPSPAGRGVRQGSNLTKPPYTSKPSADTMASRSSQDSRAAELQRLVAELDLQDVDESVIAAADYSYAYDEEKYERASLMQPSSSRSKALDSPAKDLDLHPQLTQYHVPTIALANIPSLTYDQESSSSLRRTQDLSAVAEEDEETHHARSNSKVAPDIGAFGIASWFGWSGNGVEEKHERAASNHPNTKYYLRPGDGYAGQQYGADQSPDVGGTGWWKNYWTSSLSREPSGARLDDEKEPLQQPERPAVMRQVTAGSWGMESNTPEKHSRSLPQPPVLKITTTTQPNTQHSNGESSMDSATSPSSRISPHADSPLSRLIQTSRDSFSSLNRDEVREALLKSSSSSSPSKTVIPSSRSGSLPPIQASTQPTRPTLAPRNPSFAPSSQHPSVSRVTSTTTRSVAKTSASRTTAAASAYESAVHEMMSTTDSKHEIKFVDALLPIQPLTEEEPVVIPTDQAKALPPAVGPKGKLFNLVLPSPLSPARYPYGQEGEAVPTSAIQPDASSPASRGEASASGHAARQPSESAGGNGTLKWKAQAKPVKENKEELTGVVNVTKLPEGKGQIVVGGMSLVQAKAAQAQAEAQAVAEAQQSRTTPSQQQRVVSAPILTKSILARTSTSERPKGEGKLVLPAPSQLAVGEDEDPYGAGQSANTPTSSRIQKVDKDRRKSSAGGVGGSVATSAMKTNIAGTAFEVGSIVPREAVVRASLPAGGGAPLRGYYDSIRQSWQGRAPNGFYAPPSQGGSSGFAMGHQQQRHSYTPPSMNGGVRPAMLPPHPTQAYPQQQQGRMSMPPQPPSQYSTPPLQFRPGPQTQMQYPQQYPQQEQYPQQYPQQQQQYRPQSQQQKSHFRQPPPPPPQYQPGPQATSQFQFEYYRD